VEELVNRTPESQSEFNGPKKEMEGKRARKEVPGYQKALTTQRFSSKRDDYVTVKGSSGAGKRKKGIKKGG